MLSNLKGTVKPYWTYIYTLKKCFSCLWMNTGKKLLPVQLSCNIWCEKIEFNLEILALPLGTLMKAENSQRLIVTFKMPTYKDQFNQHKVPIFIHIVDSNKSLQKSYSKPLHPSLKFCRKRMIEAPHLKGKAYPAKISRINWFWVWCEFGINYVSIYHCISALTPCTMQKAVLLRQC